MVEKNLVTVLALALVVTVLTLALLADCEC